MKKIIASAAAAALMAAATMTATAVPVYADSTQTAYDSQFLNDMGFCPDRFGDFHTTFHWDHDSEMVDKAWADTGVRCNTKCCFNNEYYIDGKRVSRETAYVYAAKKADKNYDYSDILPRLKRRGLPLP